MDNMSWTRICLRSQLLELSRSPIVAVSCNSVPIRRSKGTCIFSLSEKRVDIRTWLRYPTHAARHGETRLPTRWEGKGLLGVAGWDMSRQEGTLPFLWREMPSAPVPSRAPLGHLVGSQMATTRGSWASPPPNRPLALEKHWDDADSLTMKSWGFFQHCNGFHSQWQGCEGSRRPRTHQARPTQIPVGGFQPSQKANLASEPHVEDQPVPRLFASNRRGESIPQALIKAIFFKAGLTAYT